jgi:peptide deformylase
MKILTFPKDQKALREQAQPVTTEMRNSPEFLKNLEEMKLIAKQDGIGLAATQIGWPVQVFMLLVNDKMERLDEPLVFLNPKITKVSADACKTGEGCLSFPGLQLSVTRPKCISWEAEDISGQKISGEATYSDKAPGYFIRVIQHETDHLNGKLMIDHISSTERLKFERWLKKRR